MKVHVIGRLEELRKRRKERAIERDLTKIRLHEVNALHKNALHKRMLKDFKKNFETPLMNEKKKILEEIREFHGAIDHDKLNKHMKQYDGLADKKADRANEVK